MNRFVRAVVACSYLIAASFAAHAQNYSDIWWNPSESGWGLTVADHQSNLFAVWFTYRQDGKPAWYVIPGGTFTNGHKHFEGDIYVTSGPAFSTASFDPAAVKATKVGTAVIDFASYSAATFTYTVGGVTQSKAIQRQPFGDASPTWGRDVTDIWWNAAESGWGLTLAQHGSNIFGVWFTYDTDGRPLWAVMPGVTFNGKDVFTGDLYTTTGPSFTSAAFDPSQVVAKREGNATVTVTRIGTNSPQCGGAQSAQFNWALRGASASAPICQQAFGDSPIAARTVDFPSAPGLLEGAALLNAAANPLNASLTADDTKAVTQVIAATGGSMSVTDAKGNQFTLDVPAGALLSDTAITMTPIATLTGVRYASGVVAGLKLEPDGLVLQKNATLTIVPAGPFPLSQQTPFTAKAPGNDMVYAMVGRDFSRIQVSVPHFSWWGWLLMSPQERMDQMRMTLATEAGDRLEHWAAAHLKGVRDVVVLGAYEGANEAPPSAAQVAAWFDAYHNEVIGPMLAAIASKPNCVDALAAWRAVNYMNAIVTQLLGENYGGYDSDRAKVVDALMTIHDQGRACYYEQTSHMTVHEPKRTITAVIKATWYVQSMSGDVYDYKVVSGSISLSIPNTPLCSITTKSARLDVKLGPPRLTVDWHAHSYRGQAGPQMVPWHISCPHEEADGVMPVLYLGLFGEASGPTNIFGEIHQPTLSIAGKYDLDWDFKTCSQGTGSSIFCMGHATPP